MTPRSFDGDSAKSSQCYWPTLYSGFLPDACTGRMPADIGSGEQRRRGARRMKARSGRVSLATCENGDDVPD